MAPCFEIQFGMFGLPKMQVDIGSSPSLFDLRCFPLLDFVFFQAIAHVQVQSSPV